MAVDPISLVAGGVSLIPSLFKAISGGSQRREARRINPVDPGYVMNNGVINNARVLNERANNYTIPGYSNTLSNIDTNYSNAYNQGIQGASSGGDVLDLATKLAYGKTNATNQLDAQNAQGAEQAQMMALQGDVAAGEEYQAKNAYDRQRYEAELRRKAALLQAGNENMYGALDTGAAVAGSFLNPKKYQTTTA